MRILYITQTFPPEPGPTKRPLQQALWLKRLGHEVKILTSMPYYPTGHTQPGYRWRLFMREEIDGLSVLRVWSLPTPNRGMIRRILSQASFAITSMLAGISERRSDLVIASVPNLGAELAALAITRLKSGRVMLELRDLYPDNLRFIGIQPGSLIVSVLSRYMAWIFRSVDLIVVPHPEWKEMLKRKTSGSKRILSLPHAFDRDHLPRGTGNGLRNALQLEGKFVALYAGSFSPYYVVPRLVEAAEILRRTLPSAHLLLLGAGPDTAEVARCVRDEVVDNVTLAGTVPPERVGEYLAIADLFLAPMVPPAPVESYRNLITTKICEYLAVGRPILAIGPPEILGERVLKIGAGTSVPVADPFLIAESIRFYATNPENAALCGERARRFAEANLERGKVVASFERELCACLNMLERSETSPLSERCQDLLLAGITLLFALLPMGVIAIFIKLLDGGPVIYSQRRIGRHGRPFTILKFRTMRASEGESRPLTLEGDPRITGLGTFLRATQLDELPQLLNVLAGQMSFIGPRPEIPEFVDLADPRWQEVLQVKPGLFDEATLLWTEEARVLAAAKDWNTYYRDTVLPAKLERSLAGIRKRSIRHDIALLVALLARLAKGFTHR